MVEVNYLVMKEWLLLLLFPTRERPLFPRMARGKARGKEDFLTSGSLQVSENKKDRLRPFAE